MRVRASLLPPVAALAAFAAVQTASGSTAPPPQPQADGIQPVLAHVAAELVSASAQPAATEPAGPGPALAPAAADLTRAAAVPPRTRERPRPYRLAVVRGTVGLRYRPGGRPRLAVGSTTEFGSRRVMPVAAERGKWLGVVTTERPNNRLAWIRRGDRALRMRRTARSLHADLSARTLTLRKGGKRIHRATVAIGRPGSETPTGRFAVTDKMAGSNYGPYYGCCILALSGHQPKLPPGWTGGNRLAIHGTDAPSTIGAAASAGCLRAADADLQVLMRKVPLGTPVFIRR